MKNIGETLSTLGWVLFGVAFIVGLGAWYMVDASEWEVKAQVAGILAGPLVVAGAVIAVGGHIVDAIRGRR